MAKRVMLNEFCPTTGYHRKYAIRILNGPPPGKRPDRPVRKRGLSYGHELLAVLTSVWEAAGYPWSVWLKALLLAWMPWIRKRFKLSPEIEKQLLSISPRQMDRRLAAKKNQQRRRMYGRTKPGYLLKHHIPVKTDSWDVKSPGFTEVDLVSHSGNSSEGEFGYSLNITDIQTTWTETRALLGKRQTAVQQDLDEIEGMLRFRLLGLDSDNGAEFINWHLRAWCERKQIQLTRGRPYKKDDNAHIEQKNWTHVRKLLGWERYDTQNAVEAMNDLYRRELRLWLNLYLPSVKLLKKVRVGSKVRRVYDGPKTPFERVAASKQGDAAQLSILKELQRSLDPFQLAKVIDRKLARIYCLAKRLWERRSLRELGNPFGIPTFPQPQQQQTFSGYISNGSTGMARVTFLNGYSDGLSTSIGSPDFPLPGWQKLDWALSQINLDSSFTASVIYDLPFGKGKKFGRDWNNVTNAILGNWQVTVIEKITSGFPIFLVDSLPQSGASLVNIGTAVPYGRPDQVGNLFQAGTIAGCTGPSKLSASGYWFNPCAFAVPATGELGNASRAPLSGPDFVNTDFSVIKRFALPRENVGLDFRAEIFNLFNHAQFGLPGADIAAPTQFGLISSTVNNPRLVQFGLKLSF